MILRLNFEVGDKSECVKAVVTTKYSLGSVTCSPHYLPFMSLVFTCVVCINILQYIDHPYLALKELLRVSTNKVVVVCPHKYGAKIKGEYRQHRSVFNKKWFGVAVANLNFLVDANYSSFLFWPNQTFPLFRVPYQITVKMSRIPLPMATQQVGYG